MKDEFVKTSEKMEGFCFVTSVTGHSRPNSGMDDDDDYDNEYIFIKLSVILIK
jgi:hypothetical protein